jgi:hypothetical protein
MSNVHAAAASAVTVVTTAETVVATVGPFNETAPAGAGSQALNTLPQGSATYSQAGPQGVAVVGSLNITVGTGGTSVTVRVRQGSLTGALVGVAQVATVTAGNVVTLDVGELDASPVSPATYVVTVAVAGASANSTVNRALVTAQDATSFE